MTADVRGLRFVITGGARGMGAATARIATAAGALVVVADLDADACGASVDEIRAAGGQAWNVTCDITQDDQLSALMDEAARRMGGIDVLHNNAAARDWLLAEPNALAIPDYSRDVWDRVIAVNLTAPLMAVKAAYKYLNASQSASVINAGSIAAFSGYPGALAYGVSKSGLVALTKNLAVELARSGIRVNCYCPGYVATDQNWSPEEVRSKTATQLTRRIGTPDEIGELVCYLASKESSFVNGVAWIIDGGSSAWRGQADDLDLAVPG